MIQTEFPVDTEVLRSRIIETARSMNTQRLNVNKSGNVSAGAGQKAAHWHS